LGVLPVVVTPFPSIHTRFGNHTRVQAAKLEARIAALDVEIDEFEKKLEQNEPRKWR